MIKAVIVDDEENNRDVLKTLLQKHCPDITVMSEAGNADDAFEQISHFSPQLVFLDIKMPVKSGFDLLKMFTKIDFEVIFVTAYDHYAIRAFEFNALDYIVKPISFSRLIRAVEKVTQRILFNKNADVVFHFVKTISETNELAQNLSIHHNGRVYIINVQNIACIQVGNDHTTITLFDNTRYYSSKDLVRFESLLEGNMNFQRISNNAIINIHAINSYTKGEPFVVELKTGQSLEISRRRKAELLRLLKLK